MFGQRPPVGGVSRLQGAVVGGSGKLALNGERDLGQSNPPQDLTKPESGDATVEVEEWVDGEKTALGKGQGLQGQGAGNGGQRIPSGSQVTGVIPEQTGHQVVVGRAQIANLDVHRPPATGPLWEKIPADPLVELEQKALVERTVVESPGDDGFLADQHPLGEQGR